MRDLADENGQTLNTFLNQL